MKSHIGLGSWVVLCILGIALLEQCQQQVVEEVVTRPLPGPAQTPAPTQDESAATSLVSEQYRLQNGVVHSAFDGQTLTTDSVQRSLKKLPLKERFFSFYFQDTQQRHITYAASGPDKNAYIANSFLLGFVPFETEQIWMPLAVLSQRKRYLFDHQLYGPAMQDIWQNSRQAWFYSHGDCEDHAILLADWLIGLGYDAKVAIGKVPDGGHAWVVLHHLGTDYVLESTSKRRVNSITDFMLAPRATDYRPEAMFNRDEFWVNTGSHYTTRYRGPQWEKRSRFIRDQALALEQ